MSAPVPLRPDLAVMTGYHSPQVPAEVRLNTNESPLPPPAEWREALAAELGRLEFHRYPDRGARALRAGLAELHGVGEDHVFCANGSNEVLQCLLLAFGGAGRRAVVFEPTYALHAHIARVAATEVVRGGRTADFEIDPAAADALLAEHRPALTFLCSPNNPTGRAEPAETVRRVLAAAPGLVVVDEAYGQFARCSALALRREPAAAPGLVVVRTFSKTWAMAASRLGYLVADPDVVAGCDAVVLPYHLSAPTQVAGVLALRYRAAMERRVAVVAEERGRVASGLAGLPVASWPSDASFILFRPLSRPAGEVWQGLLARGVLVRDCSTWEGLEGCLRVTVGTHEENGRFLDALEEVLE
ncbi:MAG: histidinol-phosphate transaminase [Acidimicrobiales bacterium]